MDIEKIKILAEKIRRDFENGIVEEEKLKKLYLNYNPLENMDKFMSEAKKIFPNLNCGLASVYLKEILKKGIVKKGKYKNQNHTFLLLEDNTLIDITADQYGGPKVYVGALKYPWAI